MGNVWMERMGVYAYVNLVRYIVFAGFNCISVLIWFSLCFCVTLACLLVIKLQQGKNFIHKLELIFLVFYVTKTEILLLFMQIY